MIIIFLSMLAGMAITLGATVYLSVGGVVGALLFSVGLMTVVAFKLDLFTGKAGLLATNEITIGKLIKIWFGNFLGAFLTSLAVLISPIGEKVAVSATPILETRLGNHPVENLILGIFCGILMYIAVFGFQKTGNILFLIMPVATFIVCGFNHCVADMAYITLSCRTPLDYWVLIPTTLGNLIGCNVISWCIQQEKLRIL